MSSDGDVVDAASAAAAAAGALASAGASASAGVATGGSAAAAAAAWDHDGDVNMDGPVYPSAAERAAAVAERGLEAKRRAARAAVAVAHGLSEADEWHSL